MKIAEVVMEHIATQIVEREPRLHQQEDVAKIGCERIAGKVCRCRISGGPTTRMPNKRYKIQCKYADSYDAWKQC